MNFWKEIKYFKPVEFESSDKPGSGENMKEDFVRLLDKIREELGKPIIILSGFRTPEHNKRLISIGMKASKNSSHMKGVAADIFIPDSRYRYEISKLFYKHGIKRLGERKNFIHIDIDDQKPQNVKWVY